MVAGEELDPRRRSPAEVSSYLENERMELVAQWRISWDNSEKGRVTYDWIPVADDFRVDHSCIYSYELVSFLTDHESFKAKLAQLGLTEEGVCQCGSLETSQHVLLECHMYQELIETARVQLLVASTATLRGRHSEIARFARAYYVGLR